MPMEERLPPVIALNKETFTTHRGEKVNGNKTSEDSRIS